METGVDHPSSQPYGAEGETLTETLTYGQSPLGVGLLG